MAVRGETPSPMRDRVPTRTHSMSSVPSRCRYTPSRTTSGGAEALTPYLGGRRIRDLVTCEDTEKRLGDLLSASPASFQKNIFDKLCLLARQEEGEPAVEVEIRKAEATYAVALHPKPEDPFKHVRFSPPHVCLDRGMAVYWSTIDLLLAYCCHWPTIGLLLACACLQAS